MNSTGRDLPPAGDPNVADRRDAEAIDWAVRVHEPAFDDWEGFTDWLERDPANGSRYDAVVAALADAADDLAAAPFPAASTPLPPLAPASAPGGWRRANRRWIGGAIAAALVGGIGLGTWTQRAEPYVVETAAGQTRAIDLDDGSRVMLAGGTRLRLDRREVRMASVEAGAALFRVRHDTRDPFRIEAGGVTMTDLGTIFDVSVGTGATRVAVSEGAVMVDPDGAAVRLDPGQAARIERGRIERSTIDPADVGSWREGRLAFDDVPLAEVAADLSRHLGLVVRATSAVAGRRYRGTLYTDRVRADPALLGALLDVHVRVGGEGWTLEPRG